MEKHILRIDASARFQGSVSRDLTDRVVTRFKAAGPVTVTVRNLAESLPMIDETWIGANFTAQAERTAEQVDSLKLSDSLVS